MTAVSGSAPFAAIKQVRDALLTLAEEHPCDQADDCPGCNVNEPLAALALLQTAIEAAEEVVRLNGNVVPRRALDAALAAVRSGADGSQA